MSQGNKDQTQSDKDNEQNRKPSTSYATKYPPAGSNPAGGYTIQTFSVYYTMISNQDCSSLPQVACSYPRQK